MSSGFVMAQRTGDGLELMRANSKAFDLLYVVAMRARWNKDGFNPHGLEIGQALVGDFREMGMSEQQYRTAKAVLERHGLATFKGTGFGSIATLLSTRVWDINAELPNGRSNEQPTSEQRTSNGQSTTNEEGKRKKAKREEGEQRSALPPEALLWNGFPQLPKVLNFGPNRVRLLKARRPDSFFRDNFAAAVDKVSVSSFCTGQNDRGWRADFDWLLQPGVVAKIMEGKYDNRGALGNNLAATSQGVPQKPYQQMNQQEREAYDNSLCCGE